MPFPKANNRVEYRKNPLQQVICQLRFSPILRIESDIPAEFQESIRSQFPLYSLKNTIITEQVLNLNSQIGPQDILNQFSNKKSKNHEFISDDHVWKINLTHTFLAISTKKYDRWENFYAKFLPALKSLIHLYEPPFFTRVGLRYIDIIDKDNLGLEDTDWHELLNQPILGLLGAENVKDNIENFENLYEINLSDGKSKVRINTSFALNNLTKNKCFSLDSDFFCAERLLLDDLHTKLDFLHDSSTNLLQWVITEKLHDAMEPVKIE